jgi:hypothetical protein
MQIDSIAAVIREILGGAGYGVQDCRRKGHVAESPRSPGIQRLFHPVKTRRQ